jgi:ankyrin repeat protein
MKSAYRELSEKEQVETGAGDGLDKAARRPRTASSSSGNSSDESGSDSGSSNDNALKPIPIVSGMVSADRESAPPSGQEDHSFGTGVSNEEVQRTANDFLVAIWYPDPSPNQNLREELKKLPKKTLDVVAQRAFANNFTVIHEAAKYADLEMAGLLLDHGASRFVDSYTSKYEVDRLAKIAGFRAYLNNQEGAEPRQAKIQELRQRYTRETEQPHQALSDDEVLNYCISQQEDLGPLRNQSPLTNAVIADFVYGPGVAEEKFLAIEQDNFELIRILVHHSISPVDALCAAIDCKDADMLRFLFNMPKERAGNDGIVRRVNDDKFMLNSHKVLNAVNEISRERQVTPLMLASAARDVAIFQLLLQNQANPLITGPNGDTVLHEAVMHISPNAQGEIEDVDVAFIDYLLGNDKFGLCNVTNQAGQSALALACAQRKVSLIGHILRHQADVRMGDHFSPLHMAARYGNPQIVDVLLEARPAHTAEILSVVGTQVAPDPFQIALEEERKQILLVGERPRDAYDAEAQHDWVGVQRSLLKFAHLQYDNAPAAKDNIINSQLQKATEAINLIDPVANANLREKFHDQLKRYRDDYQHNIQGQGEKFDQAIDKNIRILGLINDLRKLADAFSSRGDHLSKAEKQQAVEEFKKCGRPRLYDDNIKTFWGALIGAVVGVIAGIIVGGVVGVFATGGPGAVIAIPTAADFGAIGGAAAGVAIAGGAAGAFTGTRVRDTLKYGFGLFKLDIALSKDLKNMPEPMAEADPAAPLVPPVL